MDKLMASVLLTLLLTIGGGQWQDSDPTGAAARIQANPPSAETILRSTLDSLYANNTLSALLGQNGALTYEINFRDGEGFAWGETRGQFRMKNGACFYEHIISLGGEEIEVFNGIQDAQNPGTLYHLLHNDIGDTKTVFADPPSAYRTALENEWGQNILCLSHGRGTEELTGAEMQGKNVAIIIKRTETGRDTYTETRYLLNPQKKGRVEAMYETAFDAKGSPLAITETRITYNAPYAEQFTAYKAAAQGNDLCALKLVYSPGTKNQATREYRVVKDALIRFHTAQYDVFSDPKMTKKLDHIDLSGKQAVVYAKPGTGS